MRRLPRPSRTVVVGGAAAVVLAGGGVAWAATRADGPAYRLATVSRGDVAQTITEVGAISSVNQRSVSFAVAGTVDSVRVSLGDVVTAGQKLATLDASTLQAQVVSANGTLASARQRLADDEASETSSAESTDAYSVQPLGAGSPSGPSRSGGGVTELQAAVVHDQKAVDAALSVVSADLGALTSACQSSTLTFTAVSDASGVLHGTVSSAAGLPVSVPSDTDAAGAPIPATTVASDGTYTFGSAAAPLRANATYTVQLGDHTSGFTGGTTCQSALTAAQHDEQQVAGLERTLAGDEQKLDAAIAAAASSSSTGSTGSTRSTGSTGSEGSTGSTDSTGSTGSTGSTNRGKSGSSPGGTTTITAAQLAADQKGIDAAAAELVVARDNLAETTLVAPIAGTVADVAITNGSSVSASSSTSTITIIGTGQKAVTTTVGIADVDLVKVGDPVSVTVDGVTKALGGRVTQIGVLNTSGTSGDTTTYPVTVVLDPTTLSLYDGAGATVAIDVGTARDVLTVPSSALTTLGSRALVSVYRNGKVTRTVVSTGVSGIDRTQVTAGLAVGERVVLANLHAAIPSSDTTSNRFSRFTSGGGLGLVTSGGGAVPGGR